MTITQISKAASRFGKAYLSAERASARKDKARAGLIKQFTKDLEGLVRRQKLITAEVSDASDEEYVSKHHPGYRFVSRHGDQIVIEEDPELMDYAYINPADGQVYQRKITRGTPTLDQERLRLEDPELWESISEWPNPWYSLILDFAEQWNNEAPYEGLVHHLDRYLEERGMIKTLTNPDTWTEEQLEAVKKYLVPAKPVVRILKPRAATDEELECL